MNTSSNWQIDDAPTAMRLRIRGEHPKCATCRHNLPSTQPWCTQFKIGDRPRQSINIANYHYYYCPLYLETEPCPALAYPPST